MHRRLCIIRGVRNAVLAVGLASVAGFSVASLAFAERPTGGITRDNRPTVGGAPAFATKSDGIVSSIESFLRVEDFAAAEKAARELTELNPNYAKGWMLLGYCQSRVSKFDESNASYDRAQDLGVDGPVVLSRKAYNFLRLGDYDKAMQSYKTILEQNPSDADALRQLGYVQAKLGDLDGAAYSYRRLLDVDPKNSEAVDALAKIEAKRGSGAEVRSLLEQALEIDPKNTEALGKLGLMDIQDKNYKAAALSLERLVALEPDNMKARRNLGVAYYQMGDKGRAAEQFQAIHDQGGAMDDLYGPLADCYTSRGARGEALSVIQEGIAKGLQRAWLYCMWGSLLEKAHDYDGAIAKFSAAAGFNEQPWSTYARKQMSRQASLKKRAAMISSQQGM
jgi:protein O-GlcNAc transferase